MANITPDFIRGFLVPFKLTADHFWSDESTLTQNGSLAGIPVSQNDSPLVITSKGVQTQDIDIKTNRAGHIQDGAGFVWKYDTDSNYYGHETPAKVMDTSMIQSPAVNHKYFPRHTIRLSSGVVLVSVEHTTLTENNTRVYRIDVDGDVSSVEVDSVSTSTLLSNKRYPTIMELPNGSINLAVWVIDDSKDVANVHIYKSTDEGETWSLVSSRALPEDIDVSSTFGAGNDGYELQPLAMASTANQVLLFAAINLHNTTPTFGSRVRQYGSTNGGLTFKFVDESESGDGSHFYLPQIVEYNGVLIIGYISSADSIEFTRMTNVFDSVFDQLGLIPADSISGSFAVGTSNRLTGGDWTMTLDTDGRLYLYVVRLDKTIVHGAFSDLVDVSVEDYAAKWSQYGDNVGFFGNNRVIEFSTPTNFGGGCENIKAVAGAGDVLLFCNWKNIGTNSFATGLQMISLGGWSSQQYPRLQPYPLDNQWGYDLHSWCPFDEPQQNSLWTRTVSGSPTDVLGGDHITLSATGTDSIKYSQGVSDKTNGVTLHTKISEITGGTVTRGTAFGVQIQSQTSTNTYHLEVVVGSNRIHVYDVHAGYGTPIGSATGLTLDEGLYVFCHVDNSTGDVFVYYATVGNPRQYSTISGRLTTDTNTTQQIYWGCPTVGGADRRADFHYFSYGLGSTLGLGWIDGDLNSKQYSPRGFYTQIRDGLAISTLDGPAREGDEYTLTPQYGSPIQRTLHHISPSPRVGWRSNAVETPDTTAVGQQIISWYLDTTLKGTAVTHIESQAMGVHLTGINFKEFFIETHNGSTWVKQATVSNTVGGAINFTRVGASIHSTQTNGPYLHLNECDGWSVLLDDGASNVVQRRIKSNGDGVLANTTSKKAYLTLEGVKATDPTSGTMTLIPSSVTVLVNANELSGFRVSITSQKTYEGYFEIGTMVAGPLVIAGPQYGRGRTIQIESNVVENTAPNGTIYTSSRGDDGRNVRIAWTDGVDTSALNANESNPNHYELYSGEPIAVMGSAPTAMMGLIQYVKASQNAIVYLPNIATGPSNHVTLNRYHNQILTTIGSEIQIDHVVGDELLDDNRGEVFRVSTVLLREVR